MSFKICHNNEIHKFSKAPLSLVDLHNNINSVFHGALPPNYRLEYIDDDGDRIVISNDYGYKEFVHSELPSAKKPLKVYVTFFDTHRNKSRKSSTTENTKPQAGPIHIQNKEEFADDLPKPEPAISKTRSGKEDAPSDESLPSSDEDHEEKVHEIYETVEDLKKHGKVDLQPKIFADPESDKEQKKKDKKEKKMKKEDEEKEEKAQKKLKKLITKIREKELSEEKKAKVVKKLMKYKDTLAARQKENIEKPSVQPKEKETQARPGIQAAQQRNPLELVVNQVLQSMIPQITRMTGEHMNILRSDKPREVSKVTHPRIICDGCNMRPITGIRYKCTVCLNFDYCENCEETMGHPHPFIKIRTPQQDYFSHGLLHDTLNRRQHAMRVASGSDRHHELYEPMHGYGPMWAPRISSLGLDTHGNNGQRHKNTQKVPVSKFGKGQKKKAGTKEREKENVSSRQGMKTDRSEDVEIEDETHLLREEARQRTLKEGSELKERQNQEWAWTKESEEEDLTEERQKGSQKVQLGDMKTKANKLKKEFPNAKMDTLIKYVEEAPEDLTTDELVKNFLAWR